MSKPLEDKDSPALKARLQSLGFEQVQFEPKVNNRFIVKIDGFPSYVIKGVNLPQCNAGGWINDVLLECYNPINTKIEATAIELIKQTTVDIKIQILTPTAEIDTEWDIVGKNGRVSFGSLNWSDEGEANLIHICFEVDSAKISHPTA